MKIRRQAARCGLSLAVLGASLAPAYSASSGTTGFSQLQVSPFARSAGLADATTALVSDSLSLHSNPAGLAHLLASEVSFQYVSHFQDVTESNLSFVRPSFQGGWGVFVGLQSVADIPQTRADPTQIDRFVESGEVDAGSQLAAFSFARRQTREFAWGATIKTVQETLADQKALSVMADAGLIYRVDRKRRLALAVQNAGTAGKFVSQSVPAPLRVRGAFYFAPRKWAQWEADLQYHASGPMEAMFGVEMHRNGQLFGRAGYRRRFADNGLGFLAGLSLGAGLKMNSFRLDYAFLPFDDLGLSHQLTVGWSFGRKPPAPASTATSK